MRMIAMPGAVARTIVVALSFMSALGVVIPASAGAQAATWLANATPANWNQTARWTGLIGADPFPNGVAYTVTIAANSLQPFTTTVVLDNSTGVAGNTLLLGGLTLSSALNASGGPAAELVLGTGMTLNAGNLTNFSGTTLSGGRYFLDGAFRFTGANVQTLAAGTELILNGTGASVRNQSNNVNALANFANNQGILDIRNGVSFAVNAGFTNSGLVSSSEGANFTINGVATNTGTLLASGVTGTGVVSINNSAFANAGGTLNAGNMGVIAINSSQVTGGILTTSGTGRITINNNALNFLDGVTLNGAVDMASSQAQLRVVNGLTMQAGSTINVNANSVIAFQGTQTIGGTGTIVFGSTGSSNRVAVDGDGINPTNTLTIGANVQIRGENGTIGNAQFIGGTRNVHNLGRISADVANGSINLVSVDFNNDGILEAANSGTLTISTNVFNSSLGRVNASTSGVALLNGASVTGGTINTTTGGRFVASNSGANFLDAVTLNGTIDLASGQGQLQSLNGLTMQSGSLINVNANSVLAFRGTQTLGGNGTFAFGNTGSSNRLSIDGDGVSSSTQLTIGANVQIRGQNGTIGNATFLGGPNRTILNNGRISADVAGGTVTITDATITNNGILEALNGGTLVLNSNVTGNVGSQIIAGAGSTVLQSASTISGFINTSGTGSFRPTNNGANYLSGVTLNGKIDMATGQAQEQVLGGLTMQPGSTINVNNNSVLAFQGTQTFGGTGTLVFGNTGSSNRLAVDADNVNSSHVLTIGPNVQIRGQNGTIGDAAFIGGPGRAIVNNGRISADVAGGIINITSTPVTNNGVLEALNGGTLILSSDVTGTLGSQIIAGAGSTVLQNGVTVSGFINTSGSGNFRPTNSGANVISGATLNGRIDMASAQAQERVVNGLTMQTGSVIDVNTNSALAFQGTQTLGGTGTIVFGSTGSSNRIGMDADGSASLTHVLTIGPNVQIRGENGTIGNAVHIGGSGRSIINNGRISADVSGGSINLTSADVVNNGVLEALNGGRLDITTNVNSTAGQINAASNGVVVLGGASLTGATINTTTGGRFTTTNNGSNVLNGATVNGAIDLATSQAQLRVQSGGLTLNGASTVLLNANSILAFDNAQTLNGSGRIVFGNTGSSNRVTVEGNGVFTIGANAAIEGQNGTIGGQAYIGGTNSIINNGRISANVAGGIILLAPSSLVNNGSLEGLNNATLNVTAALSGNGTVRADAGGLVNLANAANSQRNLQLGTSGSVNINAQNFTVNGDYTNAQAGSGNSFNRRAGVTGAGQVVAGGDAAQAITGAQVTNGTTTNATLTIGNVRVGQTNFAYQVANTGTVGPSLRGAIQTSVNGGNITDARLSGAGVTAANYGPVALGSNTGNLGVGFTAATAGVLAPMAGQAVNLRSNFENIPNQKLNIALAAGAAAYNAAVGSASPTPVNLGNTRVGGTLAGNLSVSNTAPGGAFTEKLDASFGANTGNATNNGGAVSLLAVGAPNTSMGVGLTTSASGARTGTVTLNYATNGAGTSGLAAASAGSQVVTVNGNVFQLAAGTINTAPYNFGTIQVGQSVSQALSITNSATGAAGFVEDLNATFGPTSGTGSNQFSGSGSLSGLLAGATNTTGLIVGVNATQAGVVNGTIGVNFTSAGAVNGVSNGLGTLAVTGASYGVSGTIQATASVVNAANPVINNAPINLGNVRVGASSPNAFVSVTNQATVAPQAALNASITGGGNITASGAFNLLNPGATDAASLQVGMNTATAGSKNGNASIAFVSDASNVGNCAPNCQMTLASQNVAVNGAVYRLANPTMTGSPVTLAARVGDAAPTANLSITNASPDAFTERLNASFNGSAPTGFNTNGSITGLAAGANSNAMGIALNTSTAGVFSGVANVNFISSGVGTTGAADFLLAPGTVSTNGKVYTAAVAQLNTPSVNFGIVHVGDVVGARNVSVTNGAAVTALNDVLEGNLTGGTGAFTTAGNLGSGVFAGNSDNSSLNVALNTSSAGIFSGTANANFLSTNADLADLSLGTQSVGLNAQVNNYAAAAFAKTSGAGLFSQASTSAFLLDFGSVVQNTNPLFAGLGVANIATGPADFLSGSFMANSGFGFFLSGFNAFSGIGAGSMFSGLGIAFDAANIGAFDQTYTLNSFGSNASGYSAALGDVQLRVRGSVIMAGNTVVPEPSTYVLFASGLVLVGLAYRRRAGRGR